MPTSEKKLLKQYESNSYWVRLVCLLADIAGGIFFFPFKLVCPPKKSYDPQKINKIVIFRLDGLGDLVLSTAALREIRRGFPQAQITLVVSPWAAQVIKHSPFFDRLVIYDSFLFHMFREGCRLNLGEELRLIRSLRGQNFDLGIDLRGDILSIIPLFFSNCRYRFATAGRGGRFLLTHVVPYDYIAIPSHQEKNLQVVKALGIPVKNTKLELGIDPAGKAAVDKFLQDKQLVGKRLISIAPCALYEWRSWPAEKFALLASELTKQENVAIVLIGTQEQRSILEAINKRAKNRLINVAGKFSLLEVAALLRKSALCISNESGIMHLAAAFEVPLIQLFGPGPPEPFGHYYPRSSLLQKTDCPYYPCTQRRCKNQAEWCMDKISVAEVLSEVKRLLPA